MKIPPEIIKANRQALALVKKWITREAWENSEFGYGIPERCLPLIDLPVNTEPILVDYLVTLSKSLPPVNYLEIGPSVGKTLRTFALVSPEAALSAIDLESPGKHLNLEGLDYVQGSVFDDSTWSQLVPPELGFNLIFSDACHTPEGLMAEWVQLTKRKLIDLRKFAIVWDDLDGGDGDMCRTVRLICRRLTAMAGGGSFDLFQINGWLGQHEGKHWVGCFSKL